MQNHLGNEWREHSQIKSLFVIIQISRIDPFLPVSGFSHKEQLWQVLAIKNNYGRF